jgi:hypothetical protein
MDVLIKYSPKAVHSSLVNIIHIFEVAKYSIHEVTRAEYERFYLAKMDFRMDEL